MRPPLPAEQFDDLEQQEEAAVVGMWTFLATEVLFFGGLVLAYIVYRTTYPEGFAFGGRHNNVLLGSINTGVLLTSSLTMACSGHAARNGHRRGQLFWLIGTLLLGLIFVGIKGWEYQQHIAKRLLPGAHFKSGLPPGTALFFLLYFVTTGLHALHLLIACGAVGVLIGLAWQGRFSPAYFAPVLVTGLFWHFVDIVWVFLYPMFYLIPR
ncbi:MAG: cytochrome c oxidase subunit 3 [Verrucomicrobiota bacterium]